MICRPVAETGGANLEKSAMQKNNAAKYKIIFSFAAHESPTNRHFSGCKFTTIASKGRSSTCFPFNFKPSCP